MVLVIVVAESRQDHRVGELDSQFLDNFSVLLFEQLVSVSALWVQLSVHRYVVRIEISGQEDHVLLAMVLLESIEHCVDQGHGRVATVAAHWCLDIRQRP